MPSEQGKPQHPSGHCPQLPSLSPLCSLLWGGWSQVLGVLQTPPVVPPY